MTQRPSKDSRSSISGSSPSPARRSPPGLPHRSPGRRSTWPVRAWSKRSPVQRWSILAGAAGLGFLLGAFRFQSLALTWWPSNGILPIIPLNANLAQKVITLPAFWGSGRPRLYPLPKAQEVWTCDVIVVGGSLGGVAAATHAMQMGAKTCTIEVTPWFGGQLSSQGVSAIDESSPMIVAGNLSRSWLAFKAILERQPIEAETADGRKQTGTAEDFDSCWVGTLCFPPRAGATAASEALALAARKAPGSRWSTATAFKGAEFDPTGRFIEAIYAVRRVPKRPDYAPLGRPSKELELWYDWSANQTFDKVPIRLEGTGGKRPIVIDATDTGEVIAWSRVPHRLGSESKRTTGEVSAAKWDNPECTQATTFPFVLALKSDGGQSLAALSSHVPSYPKAEHENFFTLKGFPMMDGPRSVFKYRRILSLRHDERFDGLPSPGDWSLINWSRGNNWNLMNPPLILTTDRLFATGQFQNWRGGLSTEALGHAEDRALLFAAWLMRTQTKPGFPLSYLSGPAGPMGTVSGLSMMPYIREGRRIWGRQAYDQPAFLMREQDVRWDIPASRPVDRTAIAMTHYDLDIQGCNYRNWQDPGEASKAGLDGYHVKPVAVPLEALIPRGLQNLLMGGKAIAVSHIVNGVTRIHYSEWNIGAAAGVTAAWLGQDHPGLDPGLIVARNLLPELRRHLQQQGLRWDWGPGPQPQQLERQIKAAQAAKMLHTLPGFGLDRHNGTAPQPAPGPGSAPVFPPASIDPTLLDRPGSTTSFPAIPNQPARPTPAASAARSTPKAAPPARSPQKKITQSPAPTQSPNTRSSPPSLQ